MKIFCALGKFHLILMKNSFVIIFLLFFVACQNQNDIQTSEFLKKYNIAPQTEIMYIMPNGACPSCLKISRDFVRKHADNPKICFVLTRYQSAKEAKNANGRDIFFGKNVLFDSLNILNSFVNIAAFPTKDKKNIKNISPHTIFEDLKEIESKISE
jgi:hypothetical protein